MPHKIFLRQTELGVPITVGDRRIFPISRSYRIAVPAIAGGVLWNRPVGVGIERDGEIEQIIPVQDATRRAQIGLIAVSLSILSVTWIILRMFGKR